MNVVLAALLVSLTAAQQLRTVYVATLPQLTKAMEDSTVGKIFLKNSISLSGEPLPIIDNKLLKISAAQTCKAPCTLDALSKARIFQIGGAGGLALEFLTLRNAVATTGNGSAITIAPGVHGGQLAAYMVVFENNLNKGGYGGAVWGGHMAQMAFGSCELTGNFAEHGAAVATYGGSIAFDLGKIRNNTANKAGGAFFLEGGNVTFSLGRSVLERNTALGASGGGAIVLGASSDRKLKSLGTINAAISDTEFKGNLAAGPGGAIRIGPFGQLGLGNSSFTENRATSRGGAIAADTANPVQITNTTFLGNIVSVQGSVAGQGGAAICIGSDPALVSIPFFAASVFRNVTIRGNTVSRASVAASVDVFAAHGAGVMYNEGMSLFSSCHWSDNINLNLATGKQEEDVCTFGATASANIIGEMQAPVTCDSCGGKGVCNQYQSNQSEASSVTEDTMIVV